MCHISFVLRCSLVHQICYVRSCWYPFASPMLTFWLADAVIASRRVGERWIQTADERGEAIARLLHSKQKATRCDLCLERILVSLLHALMWSLPALVSLLLTGLGRCRGTATAGAHGGSNTRIAATTRTSPRVR